MWLWIRQKKTKQSTAHSVKVQTVNFDSKVYASEEEIDEAQSQKQAINARREAGGKTGKTRRVLGEHKPPPRLTP